MADPYDPDVEDQQEQAAYDQEEAQRAQLLDSREPPQTFTGYGEPVVPPPEQAIQTAPQPQSAQQQAPTQQQPQYARVGETFTADNFQPQQSQQRGAPLAPFPQVAPVAGRKERADTDYQRRFGPIISDENYDVRPELATQPTGGLGTVVGLDLSTMGHQVSSLLGIGLKQLGASTEYIDHVNEQWQKFNEGLTASLDPSRQAAAGVSVFDLKHLMDVAGKNPGAVIESYLVTGAVGIAGGLGVGSATKLAARTAARLAGVAVETAATAGDVAGVAGAGALGGAQGAGARYEDYAHTIDHMTPEEKANSAMYQQFRRQNMDDAAAKDAMKQQFPTLQQFGANFIASTGLAAVTPGLRLGQARPTRLGNVAVGAAEAGGAGAAGTGYSSYTQQQSNVAAGAQPQVNWGQVGAEAAVGGAFGAALGGGFGALRGRAPAEALPPPGTPPPMLALPPPGEVPGPGGAGSFTMRRDTVQPAGVAPENTAALNAAGIGRQQFRPRGPSEVTIGPDETGPNIPPRYDEPAGAIYPPPRAPLGSGPAIPTGPAVPPGPPLLTASRERGPGFTMSEPAPAPRLLTASPERGPGFEVQQPGVPVRAYAEPAGPPVPPPPLPPETGPRRLTASPERGEGFIAPPEGAPVRAYAEPVGPPTASVVPPPGPPRLTASRERGPGFEAPPEGAPVRTYEEPVGPPAGSAIPPEGAPRLTATRERGAGFTMQEPEPALRQVTASRERGEGFTTEPPPAAPRPSEGLNARQLDQRLAAEGLTKPQIARLVGRDKKAAMLDKLAQEAAGRGEEPAPATPRGAETREPPAPTGRPSEGKSHKALGEALEKLGLSAREVNQLTNKVQRAAAYDRIVQSEAASLERIRRQEGATDETPTPPREEKAAPAESPAAARTEETTPEVVAPKAAAVKERAKTQRAKREAAATARADEVAATPEDTPPTVTHELPATQASRDQRNQPTAAQSPMLRVMSDDRVNAPVREAIDAGGGLHAGLRAVANSPYINKRLPHVAAYARTLLRLAPDLEIVRHTGDARGVYQASHELETGVRRNPRIAVRDRSEGIRIHEAEVLMHEATHSVVERFINNLPASSKEMQVLQTIRDEFDRGATALGIRDFPEVGHALSSPHELHAGLRNSPQLNDAMRRIIPSAEYRARMAQLGYPVAASKSLWQSFLRFIRQALNLPQNVGSLMDHVMRPLDDITKAGARYEASGPPGYRLDSMVYHDSWTRRPITEAHQTTVTHELPSFSEVRDATRDTFDPSGRLGNVLSGMRRGLRQTGPMEQLAGFNRHLFNPSSGGPNLVDQLRAASEGVRRRSEEYGREEVARGKTRNQAVDEAIKKLDPTTNTALLNSTVLDTNPAYPRDHELNSQSRATKDQYEALQKEYNALTDAQKRVYQDTFAMKRQERVDASDAEMRGIGKAYLTGIDDAQLETFVRQMRTEKGVDQIIAQSDTNPVARAFGEALDENRALVDALAREKKRGWINNYVPTARSGDWAVTYTEPPTLANGRPNPASGELGYATRATIREAEQLRQRLIVQGAEPSLVLSKEKVTPQNIPRLELIDKFEDRLQSKLAPSGRMMTPDQLTRERAAGRIFDQDQIDAARDLLTKVILDSSRFAGSMRERLGVHGADPTKLPEVMAQNYLAHKNRMGYLEYGPQVDATLSAMQRHVRELGSDAATVRIADGSAGGRAPTNRDAIAAQQFLEEARARRPVSDDPQNILTRGAQNATMFTYFKFLASPAQTIMNGAETYLQAGPRIAATMGIGRATMALARASAEIMPRQTGRGFAATGAAARGRLDPTEWNSATQIRDHLIEGRRKNDAAGITALFKRLEDGNLIGYTSYRDLQAMAKGGTGRIRNATNMAADFVSILNSKMEEGFRATAALAAYDAYTQKHGFGNRQAAIDFADKIVRTSFPNFNLTNKPRIATAQGGLGVWGIPISQFRQHGMWAYWQLSLDIRNAFKGATKEIRQEAAYAALFTAATQTVMFGTLNYLADPIRYIWGLYDILTGEKPTNHSFALRQAAAHVLGPVGGEIFSHGLARGLFREDVTQRMGMTNVLGIPEFQGDYKNPRDVTTTALTALAGAPAVSAGSEVFSGLANFASGNISQAVQDLLPKIARDPLKAYQGATEGISTRRGRLQETPEQVTAWDTISRAFGFKSARQAEYTEGQQSERQFSTRAADSRHAAIKAAADAMVGGSASDKAAAQRMIDQHKADYPFDSITFKDVAEQRKRDVERVRDPTLYGLAVSKKARTAVREQGAFANY